MAAEGCDRPRFVVGLGNPGRQYARSRHNVGFRVVDALVQRWRLGPGREAFGGRLYDGRPGGPAGQNRRVMLLKPLTYMNESGRAVKEACSYYGIACQDVLVVLDDMALPVGRLRGRAVGSAGGHKGLADVLTHLGGEDVPRLRLGVGLPPEGVDAADFVVAPFGRDERQTIERVIQLAAEAAEDWVFHGMSYLMDKYNPTDVMPPGGAERERAEN